MPKPKQPDSLRKMSFGVFVQFFVDYCNKLSTQGSLDDLVQGVSAIKKHICTYVPGNLLTDVVTRFLDEFCSKPLPDSYPKAVLEIIMNVEIAGLRCRGPILAHLDPKDAHRIRQLAELDLTYFPPRVSITLDDFHLSHLTTFIFPNRCTDRDLTIIGQNCSKLLVLYVSHSRVTNLGLRALGGCSELRFIDFTRCPVSYSCINDLLSVNTKIEEFLYRGEIAPRREGDILSHLDSSVCPSMNRFVYEYPRDYRSDLGTIVAKFPNLTDLEIMSQNTEDLSALGSLGKLTGLEMFFNGGTNYDEIGQTWGSLKALLTIIGANIKSLKLSCAGQGFFWQQDDLDFVFNACPNLEHFSFDQGGGLLVIPPFQKLKELCPHIPIDFDGIDDLDDPELEFGNLPSLETLSVINYGMNLQALEALILDDSNKFPNLSMIETNGLKPNDLKHFERIARDKNLDFQILYDGEFDWYVKYKYGRNRENDDDDDDFDDVI